MGSLCVSTPAMVAERFARGNRLTPPRPAGAPGDASTALGAAVHRSPRHRRPCESISVGRGRDYFVTLVANQICGAPLTPAFSIAAFSSGEATNALA